MIDRDREEGRSGRGQGIILYIKEVHMSPAMCMSETIVRPETGQVETSTHIQTTLELDYCTFLMVICDAFVRTMAGQRYPEFVLGLATVKKDVFEDSLP